MAIQRTLLEPEMMYHIWTHANGAENLFRIGENYKYFLIKYAKYILPVADTFAYCLMPNHLHLMVRIKNEEELKSLQEFETLGGIELPKFISRQFSHLFNSYTQAYNKMFHRKGSLFIPCFNRKLINSENYFTRLIAYIHYNPVHHGFVKDLEEWPHSSWHSYLLKKRTNLAKKEGLDWFGNKKEFLDFHHSMKQDYLLMDFES